MDLRQEQRKSSEHLYRIRKLYRKGESGAVLYRVIDQKLQNDKELWYMIDGSFITHLPDAWGLNQKYILLAINKWDDPYHKVNMGGLTCDSMDYITRKRIRAKCSYRWSTMRSNYLSASSTVPTRESLGGYGGIRCLVPARSTCSSTGMKMADYNPPIRGTAKRTIDAGRFWAVLTHTRHYSFCKPCGYFEIGGRRGLFLYLQHFP